jgi:hypothetical protein
MERSGQVYINRQMKRKNIRLFIFKDVFYHRHIAILFYSYFYLVKVPGATQNTVNSNGVVEAACQVWEPLRATTWASYPATTPWRTRGWWVGGCISSLGTSKGNHLGLVPCNHTLEDQRLVGWGLYL